MAPTSEANFRKMDQDIKEMLRWIDNKRKRYAKVTSNRNQLRSPTANSTKTQSNKFRASPYRHPWRRRIRKLRRFGCTDDIYCCQSRIHNTGVFTRSLIKDGTMIVEYVGQLIDKEEQDHRDRMGNGDYFAEFTDGMVIDAFWTANISKFINHSCDPKCVLELLECGDGLTALVVTAKRDILPMEELTFDYQHQDSEPSNGPLLCNCRSKVCRGYNNAAQNVGQ